MPVTADNDTELVLTGIGIPRWAARGLAQTIEPIQEANNLVRAADGGVINLAPEQFRKYRTVITCEDMRTMPFDGVWPGTLVTVDSVAELCYPLYESPQRDPVEGSERQEGDFIFYRPILECAVFSFNWRHNEWQHRVGWELTLEER